MTAASELLAGVSVTAGEPPPRSRAHLVAIGYFKLLVVLTLAIALASFIRDRGQLLSNISFWLFLVVFGVSLWRTQAGFLFSILLLTVTPSLHEQLRVLAGADVHAWTYPGVDCCLGFLAAWTFKGGLSLTEDLLDRFPTCTLLLFHFWLTVSAVVAVGRNLWQSASELSLRGLVYNVWLTRGISWHDDYYPLQDPFFYSAALAVLFSTWALLDQCGESLLKRLVGVVLAGAVANVVFALWQKATGLGWINGQWSINANAFWPDLHSFGAFMALALFLGYGFLVTQSVNVRGKVVVGLATLLAAVGLYLSGSRSTLFFLFALLLLWTVWAVLNARGWRRRIFVVAAIAVVGVVHWTLYHGYRGVSYGTLTDQAGITTASSLNLMLSYRPEIWAAALRMYIGFPLFGLGQGAFYRLGALPEFSGSRFLVRMNGEGVHNEILRILVELGPIGLGLLLFAAIPVLRLGRANFRLVSFYALLGLLLGNLYTNALLVRELLVVGAVFAGCYFWEAQSLGPSLWRPPGRTAMHYGWMALGILAFAAFVEVATSFNRTPFTYGQRCYEEQPLAADGWTQGMLRIPIPNAARMAEVVVSSDRPDLARRSTALGFSVVDQSGTVIELDRYPLLRGVEPRSLRVSLPETFSGKRFLELKTSNCYVPLDLGMTYDPRHLGVQVHTTRFRTAGGEEIP